MFIRHAEANSTRNQVCNNAGDERKEEQTLHTSDQSAQTWQDENVEAHVKAELWVALVEGLGVEHEQNIVPVIHQL